jgi:tRNA 2-selenouridine synthase
MIKNISVEALHQLPDTVPVIDVRTPAEFIQGHIPGAFNIPLFSNEERVLVGTTYKQTSREEAILLGFDLTGAKWSGFIKTALTLSPHKKVAVHCWRGGMRSGAMAWCLNLYGFDVYLLEGGYKRFRRWALRTFEAEYRLAILGGMTGSGKTNVLHQLAKLNEQVIDLEALAQHQGSSYGTMNYLVQPTQEQFENDLAMALSKTTHDKIIWLEDESITIGKRIIPTGLWKQMRSATVYNLVIPQQWRVNFLAEDYGTLDKQFLAGCTERIHKRLGPEQTKSALKAIEENRMADFVSIVLVYYDKTYRNGLSKRDPHAIINLNPSSFDPGHIAAELLNLIESNHHQTTAISFS